MLYNAVAHCEELFWEPMVLEVGVSFYFPVDHVW